MAILTTDDFENGRYKIPTSTDQETDLDEYIQAVETEYLNCMFGKELYDLFVIDLALPTAGEPTDPRFIKVFNAFTNQTDGILTQSLGIKAMLKGLVYYLYTRDAVTRITTVGIKQTDSENSTNISGIAHDLNSRYNESIETYKVIQNYMLCIDADTYPEFEGVNKSFNHTF